MHPHMMIDAAIPWALCRQIGMNRLMRRLEGIYTQSARHAQYTVVLLIVLVDGTKADVHVLQATKRVAVLVMHLRMCHTRPEQASPDCSHHRRLCPGSRPGRGRSSMQLCLGVNDPQQGASRHCRASSHTLPGRTPIADSPPPSPRRSCALRAHDLRHDNQRLPHCSYQATLLACTVQFGPQQL